MGSFSEAEPLHYAVNLHRVDLVEEALESGVGANARTKTGVTPLMAAAESGYDDLAKLLIKAGAKVNAKTNASSIGEGRLSALHLAVEEGHLSTCALLLENGADPNTVSQHGMTPLNEALFRKNHHIALRLLDGGAIPMAQKSAPNHRSSRSHARTISRCCWSC
jgi:ankyrin repeat protein